jgi:hypothetical protein
MINYEFGIKICLLVIFAFNENLQNRADRLDFVNFLIFNFDL